MDSVINGNFTDDEEDVFVIMNTDNQPKNMVSAYKITCGSKVEVRDYVYEEIINNEKLNKDFRMNVKRLNRWWYSIYFGSWEEYYKLNPHLKQED